MPRAAASRSSPTASGCTCRRATIARGPKASAAERAAAAAEDVIAQHDDRLDALPRLDRPAPPGARARFPDAFGRRFALFVDAEEEFDWRQPFSRDATATATVAAVPEANRRFVARGVVPTYLLDYPIVDAAPSAATFRALADADACDIGAQLHPWVTPPHDEELSRVNSFVGNLPRALEAAKLAALTARIEAATGRRPIAYRAGRYGVGPNSMAAIRALGYRLDVSVRPLFDYSDEGGPDFSTAAAQPWWIAPDLLEVPLGTAFTGALRRRLTLPRAASLRSLLSRTRLFERVALTPEGTPFAEARAGVRALLADGARVLSFSFHTPSLVPGHTPYVRDAADLAAFWSWWERMFDLLAAEGVRPVRAGEILAAAETGRGLPAPPGGR